LSGNVSFGNGLSHPADGLVHCPNCGSTDLTESRAFNLMFKTFVGPVEDDSSVA
jgi:glycyl-tRNA synthetase (class II)